MFKSETTLENRKRKKWKNPIDSLLKYAYHKGEETSAQAQK